MNKEIKRYDGLKDNYKHGYSELVDGGFVEYNDYSTLKLQKLSLEHKVNHLEEQMAEILKYSIRLMAIVEELEERVKFYEDMSVCGDFV